MSDLSVIILTKDEKLHIQRCLERLMPLEPQRIFVVDCFSTDGTQEIVRAFDRSIGNQKRIQVVEHEWPGNQAAQFNWALDNLNFETKWILRLDADEYLEPETIEEIKRLLPTMAEDVTMMSMRLSRTFLGQRVRFGVGTVEIVRLMRVGCVRYGETIMDERLVADHGRNFRLKGRFVDDNLNGVDWWTAKHLNYAEREARMAVEGAANGNKRLYYRLPPYLRAIAYWLIRYVVRGGFLDGKAGFVWHFFQGLWYRCLVDWKIGRLKDEHARS